VVESLSSYDDPVDLPGLLARAEELSHSYRTASPWPHIVLKDVFADALLDAVAEECVAIDEDHWKVSHRSRMVKEEAPEGHGPSTRRLLEALDSPGFRSFLTTVTGITDLLDDPSHALAGVHRTPPGGFTKVHRDFRVHPKTGLHHRVNVLVYLNRDWPESYGGHLELWEPDMSGLGKKIAPLANTMVIFETDDRSLHGFPDPLACPPDRARLSVASYFYTREPSPQSSRRERFDYWLARPGVDPKSVERLDWTDRVRRSTPKPIRRALHAARLRMVR
jgi:hypothetical protein